MIRKFCLLVLFVVCSLVDVHAKVHRHAVQSAIVMDAQTGAILYAKQADALTYPASITKVMTLMLLFDAIEAKKIKFETLMPVSKHATRQIPTKLWLKIGDKISVKDAMMSLITKSANDVSVVIAEALAGSEEAFAQAMTRRARLWGMKNTTFKNASGSPHPDQRTTARDMAILSKTLIDKYKKYYGFFSTKSFVFRGVKHKNHNNLLGKYEGIDGIKTGLTDASGFNLAASCVRNGRRIIAVVMGGKTYKSRDDLMVKLMETAYEGRAQVQEPVMERTLFKTDDAFSIMPLVYSHDSGNWMIQIGSYRTAKAAQEGGVKGLLNLGALYDVSVKVSKAAAQKRLKYRAYLNGFSEEGARAACKLLQREKKSCLVVPPQRSPKFYTAMN